MKKILLIILATLTLFGENTYYDQVIENDSWKDKAKIKLFDNNDSTYSISIKEIDSTVDIARGNVSGSEPFGAYGKIVTSGAVTNRLLWADGDWSIPNQTTGQRVSIQSTNAADGIDGTGIRSIHLHYLDADLNPHEEEVDLNGTNSVLTNATNIRFIQCGHIGEFGSDKHAIGTITFENLDLNETFNQIDALENRCSSSARMVPNGKRAIVSGLVGGSISGTAASSSSVSIAATTIADHDYTEYAILIPFGSIGVQDGAVAFTLPIPAVFNEGTIIAMTCSTDKAATITGNWYGWLEDE